MALIRAWPFLTLAAALVVILGHPTLAEDRLGQFRSQFEGEKDPVRRAKFFPKLGEAQIELMGRALDAKDYTQAAQLLEEYRDDVKSALAGLKATGVNAERKPAGFKQLQIHLRKTLDKLDDAIIAIPEGPRVPFEVLRGELADLNKQLIDLLFPRQPGKKPK